MMTGMWSSSGTEASRKAGDPICQKPGIRKVNGPICQKPESRKVNDLVCHKPESRKANGPICQKPGIRKANDPVCPKIEKLVKVIFVFSVDKADANVYKDR